MSRYKLQSKANMYVIADMVSIHQISSSYHVAIVQTNHSIPFQLNTGQTSGSSGLDINVEPVWMQGYTGTGVVVGFVDDGMYAFP